MTNQILELREFLIEQKVTCVVMEATGDYWKPYFYLLEDVDGLEVMLVNARDARNMPCRKTDVSDAAWLADLGAHGWGCCGDRWSPRRRSGCCVI